MLVMDWNLLYPFFGDHSAYSTNHLEVGEHIAANDTSHVKEDYTFPLRTELVPLSPPTARFDHLYRSVAQQIEGLSIAKTKGMPNRKPTGCQAFVVPHLHVNGAGFREDNVSCARVVCLFVCPPQRACFWC
jgi:hypothetical protein